MSRKYKRCILPTLLLVGALTSCNTANSGSQTVSFQEAYEHVVKNHDPHINDGYFPTYSLKLNNISLNGKTYAKNVYTDQIEEKIDINVGVKDENIGLNIPYAFVIDSGTFAQYAGYLNSPAVISLLGSGAATTYGFTINNGCLGYSFETKVLTTAINTAGGLLPLLLSMIGKSKLQANVPQDATIKDVEDYTFEDKVDYAIDAVIDAVKGVTSTSALSALSTVAGKKSTIASMFTNLSVGDTSLGFSIATTNYGYLSSINLKLSLTDACLIMNYDDEILLTSPLFSYLYDYVGNEVKLSNVTIDISIAADYK